jgi:hypothetical protein
MYRGPLFIRNAPAKMCPFALAWLHRWPAGFFAPFAWLATLHQKRGFDSADKRQANEIPIVTRGVTPFWPLD